MERELKEFFKKSNRAELKSFGRGIAGGVLSLVKMVANIILIITVIGVILIFLADLLMTFLQ